MLPEMDRNALQCILVLKADMSKLEEENSRLKRERDEALAKLNKKEESTWLLWFEDRDHPPEIFAGEDAEAAARARYEEASHAWACHLFKTV